MCSESWSLRCVLEPQQDIAPSVYGTVGYLETVLVNRKIGCRNIWRVIPCALALVEVVQVGNLTPWLKRFSEGTRGAYCAAGKMVG
jgi:hypothetical protein